MENQEALNTEVFCILHNALGQFKTKSFSQAVSCYSEALVELPDSATFQYLKDSILSLKGAALQQQGDYTEALDYMSQALILNKHHELSLLRRAKIYLKMGEIQKGLNDLESFAYLAPDVDTESILQKFENQVDDMEQNEEKYNFKKRINQLKNQKQDQQLLLSFCQLKLIDRKSNISKIKPAKKQSVYFGEEAIFPIEYDEQVDRNISTEEEKQNTQIHSMSNLTTQMKKSIIKEQLLEQQNMEEKGNDWVDYKIISAIKPQKRKTILKVQSSVHIPSILQIDSFIAEPASAINVLRIKDIDGKIVQKSKSEIKKRQSQIINKQSSRKSILKARKSQIVNGLFRRESKLQNVVNIDGKMLSYSSNSIKDIQKSNRSIQSEQQFNIYGKKEMSEDEVNSIVNNWLQQPSSQIENHRPSYRKSALKSKSSMIQNKKEENKKEKKRRTVIFKQ